MVENYSNSCPSSSTNNVCAEGEDEITANSLFDDTLSAAIEVIAEASRLTGHCHQQPSDANAVESRVTEPVNQIQQTLGTDLLNHQQQERPTGDCLSFPHIDMADVFPSAPLAYPMQYGQENCTLTQLNTSSFNKIYHQPLLNVLSAPHSTRIQPTWRQTLRPVFEKALLDRLWSQGQLGSGSPQSLLLSMWFITSRHFGVGCRTDHAKLVYGNFNIGFNGSGSAKQVHFFRDPNALVGAADCNLEKPQPNHVVDTQPDCPERCPVTLFEKFLTHRPKSACSPTSPFYLQPARTNLEYIRIKAEKDVGRSRTNTTTGSSKSNKSSWYSNCALGKNRIGSMLNSALHSIGIPIGYQTNLARFCDALVAAALTPAGGMDGIRLAELAVHLIDSDQLGDDYQQTTDVMVNFADRLIDLATVPTTAIYKLLAKACCKTNTTLSTSPTSKNPQKKVPCSRRSRSVRSKSSTKSPPMSNKIASRTATGHVVDISSQTPSQVVNGTPCHPTTVVDNQLDDAFSYYMEIKPSPPISDPEDYETDELCSKGDVICNFDSHSDVVSHQLLAQMFQDTSVSLLPTTSPTTIKPTIPLTTAFSNQDNDTTNNNMNYSDSNAVVLVSVNNDNIVSTSEQVARVFQHLPSEELATDENVIQKLHLTGIDQVVPITTFSNSCNTNVGADLTTKVSTAAAYTTTYVTTCALTPMHENQATNTTASDRRASTALQTTNSTALLPAHSLSSSVNEGDIQIDLRKSGGGSGRSVKLELRELLDLVLSAARTPKLTGGDSQQSPGSSGSSSLSTMSLSGGLLRPPVGLVTQLLWRARALDDRGPWILTFAMWWLMQYYFGIGSRMHHVRLRWGHLRLVSGLRDPITDLPCEAIEYVGPAEYATVKACALLEKDSSHSAENVTSGGDDYLVRRVYPSSGWAEAEMSVAAALSNESLHERPKVRPLYTSKVDGLPTRPGPDFVALYKMFARRRQQPSLAADAPFYVQPLNLRNPQDVHSKFDTAWFSVGALGKNRIGALMRNIVDKVVRPNLPRIASAAATAARNACIAAASRAAIALPSNNELSWDPSFGTLPVHRRQEWLLNKLSCLLGLCTKSTSTPDNPKGGSAILPTLSRASKTPIKLPQQQPPHSGANLTSLSSFYRELGQQKQSELLVQTNKLLKGGSLEEGVHSMTLNGAAVGQHVTQSPSVIILPQNVVGISGGLQVVGVTPLMASQCKQEHLCQPQPTAVLSSNLVDISTNTVQQQQEHKEQFIGAQNSVYRQLGWVAQTDSAKFGVTPLKLILIPSNTKSANTTSVSTTRDSPTKSQSLPLSSPVDILHSINTIETEQHTPFSTGVGTILSPPITELRTLSLPVHSVSTTNVAMSLITDGMGVVDPLQKCSTPLVCQSDDVRCPPIYVNLSSLPTGIKIEQPSPGAAVDSVNSSFSSTSYVSSTNYCQTDSVGNPTREPAQVICLPQSSTTQLSSAGQINDRRSNPTVLQSKTSIGCSPSKVCLVTSDCIGSTGTGPFTAIYNPTTNTYEFLPTNDLVAVPQPLSSEQQQNHQQALVTTVNDSFISGGMHAVGIDGKLSHTSPATVHVFNTVDGGYVSSNCGETAASEATVLLPGVAVDGSYKNSLLTTSDGSSHTETVNSIQAVTENKLCTLPRPILPGKDDPLSADFDELGAQWQLPEPSPSQLRSLQSVISSASAFQCADFPAYVEQLFRSGVLGAHRPWCLNFTVWFINTLVFEVENRTDHVNLRWGDFHIAQTADGQIEYLYFFNRIRYKAYYLAASSPSPHNLGFITELSDCLGTDTSTQVRCPCPVAIFKMMRDRRPRSCLQPYSKLYLQPRNLNKLVSDVDENNPSGNQLLSSDNLISSPADQEWFTEHAWGKNKLGSLFAEAAKLARLPVIWLRKHRSRNFLPSRGDSGIGASWCPGSQSTIAGAKRPATAGSGTQEGPTEVMVKRRRCSTARKKQWQPGQQQLNQSTGFELVSGITTASAVSDSVSLNSVTVSSSMSTVQQPIQLPSSSTILQPKGSYLSA